MRAGADSQALHHGSERFSARDRVRRRSEYRRVQSTGQRVHSPRFVWLLLANGQSRPRLGITVTKKVASAVGRNRIKRVVREVFRRHRHQVPAGFDLVAIAKREALGLSYAECSRELSAVAPALERAARRAGRAGATP